MRLIKDEISKKQKQLGIQTPKQKDLMQDAIIAQTLNTKLEQNHSAVVTSHFKHSLLYGILNRKEKATNSNEYN